MLNGGIWKFHKSIRIHLFFLMGLSLMFTGCTETTTPAKRLLNEKPQIAWEKRLYCWEDRVEKKTKCKYVWVEE